MDNRNQLSRNANSPIGLIARILVIGTAALTLYSAQALAACPSTYPTTMSGVTENNFFSSTDFSKARPVGQAYSRVLSTVTSSNKSGNITTGTLKMVNDWGSSGSPTGGSLTDNAKFTFDHTTCQGSFTAGNGEVWLISLTENGKTATFSLQSWKNSTQKTPHTGISHLQVP